MVRGGRCSRGSPRNSLRVDDLGVREGTNPRSLMALAAEPFEHTLRELL